MTDTTLLVARLSQLPQRHQIVFGASCTERLLPNYVAFFWMENWGDPKLLRHGLDLAWSFVKGSDVTAEEFDTAKRRCIEVAPDLDDFQSAYVGCAMRAAVSVAYVLDLCLGQRSTIHWIVEEAFESIRQYLARTTDPHIYGYTHDPKWEYWIERSPLMDAELDRQMQTYSALQKLTKLDADWITQLQMESKQGGIQPIERKLVVRPTSTGHSGIQR